MRRLGIGGLVGLMLSIILVGCGAKGATGQVESLSPDEMKHKIQNSEEVYILVTDTSEKQKREKYINLVEETIEEVNVHEINAQNPNILNGEIKLSEIGLEGGELFQSLSYYENGKLIDRISLREQKYETIKDRKQAINQFIEKTSS